MASTIDERLAIEVAAMDRLIKAAEAYRADIVRVGSRLLGRDDWIALEFAQAGAALGGFTEWAQSIEEEIRWVERAEMDGNVVCFGTHKRMRSGWEA